MVELAAVIAVPPTLFYVLGVGALWVQLSSEYDLPGNDNAWFAASLVARSTTAGLGVEVVLRAFAAQASRTKMLAMPVATTTRLVAHSSREALVKTYLPTTSPNDSVA